MLKFQSPDQLLKKTGRKADKPCRADSSRKALLTGQASNKMLSFNKPFEIRMDRLMNIFHVNAPLHRSPRQPAVTWLAGIVMISALFGCAHTETVMIPPKMDLAAYTLIGVISSSSDAQENLKQYATETFMGAAVSAQPGVRLLELGPKERLLKSMGRSELDFDTIRRLGKAYQIDAVITVQLQISDAKPDVHVRTVPAVVRAGAYVDAVLSSKLYETDSGATLWSQSSSGSQPVAHLGLRQDGTLKVGVSDPDARLRDLIQGRVLDNTRDLRPTYVTRKID